MHFYFCIVCEIFRLGIFGFFARPELTKESAHKASGNYGLMDQIQALRWMQQNSAKFRCGTVQELIWHTTAGNPGYEHQFSRTVHGQEAQGAPHASEIPLWRQNRHNYPCCVRDTTRAQRTGTYEP
jgi:carboxylesterase type B